MPLITLPACQEPVLAAQGADAVPHRAHTSGRSALCGWLIQEGLAQQLDAVLA